jgi:diguanylate cyclase (GGDEF)-like protein
MTEVAGAPGLLLGLASAIVVTRGTKDRLGPERWVAVTAWICVADLVLTFGSLHRYSVGWYVGRGMTVIGISLVFLAMLYEFTSIQRQLLVERGDLMTAARTDPLTGLANRTVLYGTLGRRIRAPESGYLVLFDLDRFKSVNDTHGHQAGDAVLLEFARRLLATSRPEDLAARLGGDEFALLLAGPFSPRQLGRFLERLQGVLDQPYLLDGRNSLRVSVSAGSTRLADHETVESVVRAADDDLYQAKRRSGSARRVPDRAPGGRTPD